MRNGWRKEFFCFFSLLVLSSLLFFSDHRGKINRLKSWVEKPVLAVQKPLYALKISFLKKTDFFGSAEIWQKEANFCQAQLRRLAFNQNLLNNCLSENEKMRRLLGAPLPASWQFLPAKVVGWGEEMKINQGEKNGVKAGMVVVFENILSGRVKSVGEKNALVETPLDVMLKIPVVVKKPLEGESAFFQAALGIQAKGILSYKNEKLKVEKIIQSEDVKKGDLVLTSGEGNWPPDLLIGQVERVEAEGASLYKEALMAPLLDYSKLETVFVITNL